jgi:hypothetical protein
MSALLTALDAAVVAYREDPTEENRLALFRAMEAYQDDFFRREREEALARAELGR